jgi:hypothetical protein
MRFRLSGLTMVVSAAVALAACASGAPSTTETPDGPAIVAIFEDVNWYPPCAISPIELGGDLYYPLPMGAPPVDASLYPVPWEQSDAREATPLAVKIVSDVSRVVPPGPGDDIGTVIVYSDGMARFESHSGNVAWLTREVQEYGYVC